MARSSKGGEKSGYIHHPPFRKRVNSHQPDWSTTFSRDAPRLELVAGSGARTRADISAKKARPTKRQDGLSLFDHLYAWVKKECPAQPAIDVPRC
jgi:hypothetical protein